MVSIRYSMKTRNKVFEIIVVIISILIIAVLGSIFVNLGSEWFNLLIKPTQWIPNIIIPIVWTIIYITFGIILSLWIYNDYIPLDVVVLLIINGVLNILWCLLFFTLYLTFVGNIVIIFNLIASIILIVRILHYKPLYAYLTIIYPLWLCLATSLNLAIWILN